MLGNMDKQRPAVRQAIVRQMQPISFSFGQVEAWESPHVREDLRFLQVLLFEVPRCIFWEQPATSPAVHCNFLRGPRSAATSTSQKR